MSAVEKSDKKLLSLIQKKNQSAFVAFYNRYIRLIYKFVLARVKDQQIADDLVQDFWLRVWSDPSFLRCDAKDCAKTYLINNFRFRIIDLYYSKRYQTVSLEEYNLTDEDHSWYAQMSGGMEEKELVALVHEALQGETETMKKVFWMRVNDISSQETADALNISLRTVYNNYHESLQVVKNHLVQNHPDVVSDIKKNVNKSSVSSAVGILGAIIFWL